MKNKWVVFGTLLGVALGAGLIYFGYKKFKDNKSEPKEGGTIVGLTNRQFRKLAKDK